ncbi:acyl-homoserine-lactone synthase [Pseudomonas sp. RIT-PI-S]|uniref:acyl-homoserine-lactone synthase n=1 Tax=Pseudomonas sp. RIT-PI-S TaxID=3035295 RepID=UPI0021DAD2A7|nr:acyl-homoserine-lactone synthase [Pseudomonas sp. RIT-PI-S]
MDIAIDRRANFNASRLQQMHTLRAKIFRDKKEWDVSVIAGMEIDGYDALDPYYMILGEADDKGSVYGCWRLLPTLGPNMLADTFPELLNGDPAPRAEGTWELSRFAIEQNAAKAGTFSQRSLTAIRAVVQFGVNRGLVNFVTVTTVGVEKLLIRLGLDVRRLGPARVIGVERAVALSIQLNTKTLNALAE